MVLLPSIPYPQGGGKREGGKEKRGYTLNSLSIRREKRGERGEEGFLTFHVWRTGEKQGKEWYNEARRRGEGNNNTEGGLGEEERAQRVIR